MNDLNLVHIVDSEIGEIEIAAGKIYGSAVDENFGERGVATVNKDGGEAANWPGAGKTDAGLRGEKIGKQHGLALVDFVSSHNANWSGSLGKLGWLSVGGDDDVGREGLEIEAKIQSMGLAGREVDD